MSIPTAEAVSIVPDGLSIGLQLPIQSGSTAYARPWEASGTAADLVSIAQACESAGFFYVAVCDHVAIPEGKAPAMSTRWFDTVATLGWLAGQTERIHLLSHVYVPAYRHPLVTAKAFATLDHLSGGRIILGVGAGHVEAEFDAVGADFERRGPRLDDAIDTIVAAWTQEWVDVGGPEPVSVAPSPARAPRPPIWVGGSSRPAMRRAADRGDGWLPQGPATPDAIAFIVDRRAETRAGVPIDLGGIAGGVYVGDPVATHDLPPHTIVGPPEKIAHILRKVSSVGISHLQVRFETASAGEYVEQIHRFGDEVMPLL